MAKASYSGLGTSVYNPKNLTLYKNDFDIDNATYEDIERFENTLHITGNGDFYIADQFVEAKTEEAALKKFANNLKKGGLNGLSEALKSNGKYDNDYIRAELSSGERVPNNSTNGGWVTYIEDTGTPGRYYIYHSEHKDY